MRLFKRLLRDRVYVAGLILLTVSLIIFCIPEITGTKGDDSIGYFFLNYLITIIYYFHLVFDKRISIGRGRGVRGIFLVLMLISAYALNRIIGIFESSAPWLSILLVISCINYLLIPFKGIMPRGGRYLHGFVLGVSFLLFCYLSLYLLPGYLVSTFLVIAIGLSLHAFIAILFVIYTLKVTYRHPSYYRSFITGIAASLAVVVIYAIAWGITARNIDRALLAGKNKGVPAWVNVAQQIPHHFLAQQLLKAGLVYSVPPDLSSAFFFRFPSRSFDEVKKHDPLIMIAALFSGSSALETDDRIKVLEAMYDSRHQAQERLWSGDQLTTAHVNTAARIWPQLHMAYTEKTITVFNHGPERDWNNQQEAIYTFHLPEGAVVSSLSLWINDKEQKGILTTKAKADSAYKQIVGIEQHDPSVVHWQEGNTVSVRVFPVVNGGSRRFKIGITSPLLKVSNQLVYRNIYFDGPGIGQAREDVTIDFESTPYDLMKPRAFDMDGRTLRKQGGYQPGWEMSFTDKGIRPNSFSANGKTFSIGKYQQQLASMEVHDVYLDISSSWTNDEYEDLLTIFKNQNKWVYENGALKQLTNENSSKLFASLNAKPFSLFPLYQLKQPATALLITKGQLLSPTLSDLEGTFTDQTKTFLARGEKVCLFNLGGELSPYLRALKECRAFRYDQGAVKDLKAMADKHLFPASIENSGTVVIEPADIMITAAGGTGLSNAPDHLQRLFAYNHIMQQSGSALLTDLPENDSLVQVAKEAYVVTPFSSLVVLETQADYDRFNIADSENSLKNASLHSQGAVPEPHEWALIILGILILLYVRSRKVAI